jgi:hypothetical protein
MMRAAAGEGEAPELPFREKPSKRYVGNWCVLAAATSTQLAYGGGWLLSPERCGLGRRLRRFCLEVLGGVRKPMAQIGREDCLQEKDIAP